MVDGLAPGGLLSLRRLFSKVKADARRADYTAEPAATLAVRHRLHWDEGAILWAIDDSAADDGAFAPLALQARQPLLFEIVPPVDALGTLFVKVGTYRRTNVGTLRCSLRRPSSMALALGEIDLSNLEDNAFAAVLDLRGVAFEAGRPCWVELELDAEPGNEIALYHAAAGETHPAGRRQLRGFNPEAEIPADEPVRGLLPNHRLDWAARDAFWSTWPSGASEPPGPHELEQRRPFEFDIVAPAPRIDTLSMQFGTYNRRSRSHIALELVGPEGEILHREGFDLAELVDNAFAPVAHLSQIALKPGRKYRARLHWLGPEGEGVALYAAPVRAGRYEFRPHLERLDPERVFAARSWAKAERATDRAFLILDPSGADRPGAALDQVRMVFPGLRCSVLNFEEARAHLDALRAADVVVFVDMYHQQTRDGLKYDDLCFDLHRNRVCTIFLDASTATTPPAGTVLSPALRSAAAFRRGHARRCHYLVSSSADAAAEATWPGGPAPVRVDGGLSSDGVASLVGEVRRRSRPRVGIVSVLHRKADIIETFLEHVRDQTYPGPITTVLVDDLSPDDDAARASAFGERLRDAGRDNRSVVVLRNAGNLGNCASRLVGIAEQDADLLIVVDCDCLMNRDFVAAHVFEHWWDDVDAVTGPLNIESDGRDPAALVRALEHDPAAVKRESRPQDPLLPAGLVNCVTRNFSIKRRAALAEPLFDLAFSYSAEPGSGFGWEDVEMGYRLYERGVVVRFTERAFAVHCSHASSMPDAQKVVGSTRNFAKLFRKHPELPLVARRWATDTYDRIALWQDSLGVASGPERLELDRLFAEPRRRLDAALPLLRGEARRLRVLTSRWHAPHQYEIYKLGHDFTLVTGLGAPATDVWSYNQRPLQPNARLVPVREIDPGDFDVVLLHFDENVMAAHLCNGIIPASWGDAFRRLLDLPGLPKIAVCHGTVPFVGQFGVDPDRKAIFEPHDEERRVLVDALSAVGARVVCNSHQALAEWGFENARVIWHGFDPQEFPRGTLERDVLALEADGARPHYRGAWELTQATSLLAPGIRVETAAHPGAPIENRSQNPYAVRNFRSYVDRIRQFKFYLNTTLRSPMPRSRGEAMMTGVIPVCLRNHDVDLFIENGVDGFYSDRPEELAEFINAARQDSGRLAAMSAAARRKALDIFNHDRYLAEWDKLLRDVA
jgi:glycosyltransferase involved in cell wall biosynthesis